MKTLMISTVLATGLAFLGVAANAKADAPGPTIVLPSDVKWGDPPPTMPPGAKIAALNGDPSKAEMFTIRIKFPGGYKVPAHSHSVDEQITVLSGAFLVGVGDKLDPKQTKALPAGAFVAIPAKLNHYAMTKKETVIELTAMGPFEMTYANPADDPSKSAMK
jgi:quercetin dioxygenase-like cupin family protein